MVLRRSIFTLTLVATIVISTSVLANRARANEDLPTALILGDPGNCGDCTANCGTHGNPGHQVTGTAGDKIGRHPCKTTSSCDDHADCPGGGGTIPEGLDLAEMQSLYRDLRHASIDQVAEVVSRYGPTVTINEERFAVQVLDCNGDVKLHVPLNGVLLSN